MFSRTIQAVFVSLVWVATWVATCVATCVASYVIFGKIFHNLFNGSWVSMAVYLFAVIAILLVDFLLLALIAKFVSEKLMKGIKQ